MGGEGESQSCRLAVQAVHLGSKANQARVEAKEVLKGQTSRVLRIRQREEVAVLLKKPPGQWNVRIRGFPPQCYAYRSRA